MTVPRDFRRNSRIPEILVLHRAHLDTSEVQEMHGVRVKRARCERWWIYCAAGTQTGANGC